MSCSTQARQVVVHYSNRSLLLVFCSMQTQISWLIMSLLLKCILHVRVHISQRISTNSLYRKSFIGLYCANVQYTSLQSVFSELNCLNEVSS